MRYINYIGLALLSVFMVGCGPIYNTQYNYIPPRSSAGIMCINTCEVNKSNCEHIQELKKDNCEYRSELDYRWCLDHASPEHKEHCYRRLCGGNSFRCNAEYNRCYQGCGGVVEQQTVCVAFCR
jgi:hypothetical protein